MKTIRELMTTELVSVHADTPTIEAIELLITYRISGLPVIDREGFIVGVLSEKDLLRVLHEKPSTVMTVGSLMTRDSISIAVEAPLVDVFDCLLSHDFRRVLIHDGGKLVGVISRSDLMPALLEVMRERSQGST